MTSLSKRGQRALQPALSYWGMTMDALKDEASAANPDGYVIVSVAENRVLNAPKFLNRLHASLAGVGKSALGYDDFTGRPGFKDAYAAFATATLLPTSSARIDSSHLCVSSGAGSLLAHLSSLLHDEGDGILLPTPTYGALYNDFSVVAGTKVLDVPMEPNYDLSLTAFDAAYDRAKAQNVTPKSVLLLNPDNPLGVIRSSTTVRALSDWCQRRGLHLIVDEIYANSVHTPANSAEPFVSAIAALGTADAGVQALPSHVHIIWGFSKDWATSGLRVGVLCSSNADVRQALSNVLYFSGVPNYLLDGLATMLGDLSWCQEYLAENNAQLRASYIAVTDVLTAYDVPFIPASAGMFVWIDLGQFLKAPTWASEQALTQAMFEHSKFIMTPGEAQHAPRPGLYRICFAYNTPEMVALGLDRTLRHLRAHPQ
ncbi:1-aminocyclopropane-1-carboxylate synthase [Achlya hypogyna]|uniref:1-aminocyclopropane-1-carboxylate synthase n=1 Tax=Achlya hypogyna TaxID=1202772 RepID=A0A1V9Z229_ACHHY|nr:1-aminocyclopropane-1-carboxylate synthase [Achlya hypogyna]